MRHYRRWRLTAFGLVWFSSIGFNWFDSREGDTKEAREERRRKGGSEGVVGGLNGKVGVCSNAFLVFEMDE